MNSLTNLINDGVTSIEPWHDGVKISFEDDTNLYIESNADEISIWGTHTERDTRIRLQTHILTKAKLIVQELTAIIEKIEAEQS